MREKTVLRLHPLLRHHLNNKSRPISAAKIISSRQSYNQHNNTLMKSKGITFVLVLILVLAGLQNCKKTTDTVAVVVTTPNLPATPYNYSNVIYPPHIANYLPTVDNTPSDNPITDNGATLGRVLFYDKHLSHNNTISCANCHNPSKSFSDDARLSTGFAGGLTARHSMQLLNVRFYASGKMFWDERANTLEDQVLMPIQNQVEMGMTLAELDSAVAAQSYYPSLFQKAFGSADVTSDRISKALSQFVRSIVTYQSKYDKVKQGLATFTANEALGEQTFLTKGPIPCAGCHNAPMFMTSSPQGPFGLPDPADAGINNQHRFKVGSLRNIANTAPYFHNGTVPSLNALLGTNIPTHSVQPQDVAPILAFLNTLTDNSVTTEEKFSTPFK
jgi:cytochrome c peroxidase